MRIAKGREIYIITAVVAIVLIVAWYFLLLSPSRAKLSDLDSQVQAQQAALTTAQQDVARLESYKKTAPQARAEIVRLGKMLPESEGIPSLIIELTRTADASGVDLNSITRGGTQPGTPFGLQTVTLQVTGRFFDVEDFLYRLESYVAFRNAGFRVTGRLLEVTTVSLSGGTTAAVDGSTAPLTVSVGLTAYLWAGPGSAAAGGAP
jgi:type IV pilus assembly protein PilO